MGSAVVVEVVEGVLVLILLLVEIELEVELEVVLTVGGSVVSIVSSIS